MASAGAETKPSCTSDLSRRRSISVKLPNLNFRNSPVSRVGDSGHHLSGHNVGLAQLVSSISKHSGDKGATRSNDTGIAKDSRKPDAVGDVTEQSAESQIATCVERELLMLIHGLKSHPDDYTYFVDTLRPTRAHRTGQLMVHVPSVNTNHTDDSNVNGGTCLVEDIRTVICARKKK